MRNTHFLQAQKLNHFVHMLEKFVYSKHAEIAVLLGCTKEKQSTSNSMNPIRKIY